MLGAVGCRVQHVFGVAPEIKDYRFCRRLRVVDPPTFERSGPVSQRSRRAGAEYWLPQLEIVQYGKKDRAGPGRSTGTRRSPRIPPAAISSSVSTVDRTARIGTPRIAPDWCALSSDLMSAR